MPSIVLNNTELSYEEHGSGEDTVIYFYGWWGVPMTLFQPLIPDNVHAYALDVSGHGKSATYAIFADYIFRFSQELGLREFVYVGTSHGGGVGYEIALRYPEVLKAFVAVISTPFSHLYRQPFHDGMDKLNKIWDDPGARRKELMAQANRIKPFGEKGKQALAELVDHFSGMTREQYFTHLGRMLPQAKTEAEMSELLKEIRVPTLLICGCQDPLCPAEFSLRTLEAIPHAKAVFFQDEAHGRGPKFAKRVRSEIVSFLGQLKDGVIGAEEVELPEI